MSEPARVRPTYNSALTGPAFTVQTREGNRQIREQRIEDPFINTTFHVRGWRNALRVLFRRYECSVVVSGHRDVIEDVLALDADKNVLPVDKTLRHRLKQGQLVKVHGDSALLARVTGWEWSEEGWRYKVKGEIVPIDGGPFSMLELAPITESPPSMAAHGSELHLAGLRDEAAAEDDPL